MTSHVPSEVSDITPAEIATPTGHQPQSSVGKTETKNASAAMKIVIIFSYMILLI